MRVSPGGAPARSWIPRGWLRTASLVTFVIVTTETLIAVGLGTRALGDKSLWLDEAISVNIAHLDLGDFWQTVSGREAMMPLYYLILRAWTVFGSGEAAMRSLSVVFAAATVPALYALTARLFNRRAAVCAGLLLAVNEFALHYSQEARTYALLMFLATLSTLLFVRAVDRRSTSAWVAYVAVAALAVYAHLGAAMLVIAHVTALVLSRRRSAILKPALIAAAAVGVLSLPLMIAFSTRAADQVSWIHRRSPVDEIAGLTRAFAGDSPLLLGVIVVAGVLAVATPAVGRRAGGDRWPIVLTVSWLVAPVLMLITVSLLRPFFVERYLILSLPPLMMLVAVGVTSLRPQGLAAAAVLALVALSLPPMHDWYSAPAKEDWRRAESYVLSNSTPADAILIDPFYYQAPFGYYVDGDPRRTTRLPTRIILGLRHGTIVQLPFGFRRIWLVSAHDVGSPPRWSAPGYRVVSAHRFPGVTVSVMQQAG